MSEEKWAKILDRDDYEVSNRGNVRRNNKGIYNSIKPKKIPNGYLQLAYFIGKKRQYRYIHRLVAAAFVSNNDKLPWVNHIDGVKTNNSAENLEWVTPSINTKHAFRIGLNRVSDVQKGDRAKRARLFRSKRIEQLTVGGELIKTWYNACDVTKEIGLDRANIAKAAREGLVRYGYRWRYVS